MRMGFNLHPAFRSTGGRVVHVAPDLRHIRVRLPLTWKTKNIVGSLYGGSLFAITDGAHPAMLMAALSGSRGPMIGIPFTALAAAVFVWRYRFNGSRRSGLVIAAGVVAVLCAGALLLQGRSATLFAIAGVSTNWPPSQCRALAVTSRMLISGLKLVAKACP